MNGDVLNLDEFLERVQDDTELLLELLDIFVDDFKAKRLVLSEAVKNNDLDTIASIAHSLKGASGNISAKRIRENALTMEQMAKSGDISNISELLATLDKEFDLLQENIKQVKDRYQD